MKDKFVERYFANLKQTPNDIKNDYENTVELYAKPGVYVLMDNSQRYSALYTDEENQSSYLVEEFWGDAPISQVEYSYKDPDGNFINLGQKSFCGQNKIINYTGFKLSQEGEIVHFSAVEAKENFDSAHSAIQNIFESQLGLNAPTES